ncbi:MAG: nuclear transport factor 2 family protein [Sphingobium sp.]
MKDWSKFAEEWQNAWNAHDLERLLAHFHDDILFTSPVAAGLLPETKGYIRGKEALRAYWAAGLRHISDLHFTVEQIFAGMDTLVIQYRNQKDVVVSEVLHFSDGKVREGHGTYPPGETNPAGARA